MKQTPGFFLALALLASVSVVSCAKNTSIASLQFPSTPAVSTENRFALVIDPYVTLRDIPGEKGITMANGRRGDIYEVTGSRIIPEGVIHAVWLNLGKGWVNSRSVQLYSSEERAQTAADALR